MDMNWWKRKNKPKLFNKDVGLWDLKNTTDIDNIAYYLYCKKDVIYLTDTYDIVDGSERGEIIYTNNGWSRILLSHNNFVNQDISKKYYKEANILIRKIKIKKLKLC